MTATIHIKGVIGKDTTLVDVIRQFKSFDNPSEVVVYIFSEGGYVDEGNDIYNYLKNIELPVTTRATMAYSIAASIFMSGDKRIVEEGNDRLMIHLPWCEMSGGSKDFEAVSKELKALEKDFVAFYRGHIDLDEETIYNLLENETFLTAAEAKNMGFATEIYNPLKAVAYYNKKNIKTNMKKDKKNIKTNMKKDKKNALIESFYAFFNLDAKALLELQDSNGDTIVFPDLYENDTFSEGDKVEKDGNPADGEILMPDGKKVIAEEGVVKEIIEAESDDEQEEQEDAEAEAEAEAKEAEKAELVDVLAKFEKKIIDANEKKIKSLEKEILALKKNTGSKIDNEPKGTERKTESKFFSASRAIQNKRNKNKK